MSIDRRESVAEAVAIKAPCRLATTANITLSGLQSIDGVTTVEGDRILVKSQSDGVQNGIYAASTGNWERTKDFDGSFDVVTGTAVYITAGSAGALHTYIVTTTGTILPGTTSIAFAQDQGSAAVAAAAAAVASAATASSAATSATASAATATAAAAQVVKIGFADTRANAILTSYGATTDVLYTGGYAIPDDQGGAKYVHASGTTAGGFQSADGQWWKLALTDHITPQMFGAAGDGVDSVAATSAFTDFINFWKDTGEVLALIPSGTYPVRTIPSLLNPFGEMKGVGWPTLKYTGLAATNVFDVQDASQIRYVQNISGINFDGGTTAQGTLHFHNVDHATFSDIGIVGAASGWNGILIEASVLSRYRLTVSNKNAPSALYSSAPFNGIILGSGTASTTQVVDNTFDLTIENVAGPGIALVNAVDNIFTGTSEGCTGIGLTIASNCYGNHFDTMLFEANGLGGSFQDIQLDGDANIFTSCEASSTSSLVITGNRNIFIGGRYRSISNVGIGNIFIGVRIINTSGWTDGGTNTVRFGCFNEQSGIAYSNMVPRNATTAITLNAGWASDANYVTPSYYLSVDGETQVQGRLTTQTTGTVFTLAAGYRPTNKYIFDILNAAGGVATFTINTNGTVVQSGTTSSAVSMGAICFPTS